MAFDLIVFVVLLACGFAFGRYAENRHYRSIIQREEELRGIPAIAIRFPPIMTPRPETALVSGSVVIAEDYFKRFLFGLRSLVGGRVRSYETLVDRGRREAIIRMKQQTVDLGGSMVFNIKLETAAIASGRKGRIGAIEIHAYGTAIIPTDRAHL
ncbi:MAG: YbjQ family protein [Candidatus Polarisedimenticolaceae bacterium]|nr:YbjQ family protein [Candidatus Polarisedimenticolaceae bacterium]